MNIPKIERQMMFLNEPTIQSYAGQTSDIVKHILKVHQRCISYQYQSPTKGSQSASKAESQRHSKSKGQTMEEAVQSTRAETAREEGQSFSELYPKDYDKFKTLCIDKLASIDSQLSMLKSKMFQTDKEVEDIIRHIEREKGILSDAIRDFTLVLTNFNEKALQLHSLQSKVEAAKEVAQSQLGMEGLVYQNQKAQLMKIIEGLTIQLKHSKIDQTQLLQAQQSQGKLQRIMEEMGKLRKELGAKESELLDWKSQVNRLQENEKQLREENRELQRQIEKLEQRVQEKDFSVFNLSEERKTIM